MIVCGLYGCVVVVSIRKVIEMRAFSASKPLRSGAHHGLGLSRRSAYENQIGAAIVDDALRHAMRACVLR